MTKKNVDPATGEFDMDSFGNQEGATEPLSEEDLNKWLAAQTATGGGNGDQGALADMGRNQFTPVDVPEPDAGERERMRQLGQLGMLEGAPIEAETFERAPSGFSVVPPERMPPEHRLLQVITDDDILDLANRGVLPDQIKKEILEGKATPSQIREEDREDLLFEFPRIRQAQQNPRDITEEKYQRMSVPERVRFLVEYLKPVRRSKRLAQTQQIEAPVHLGLGAAKRLVGNIAPVAAAMVAGSAATMGSPIGGLAGLAAYVGAPYIKEKYGSLKAFVDRANRLDQTEAELEELRRDMAILKGEQGGDDDLLLESFRDPSPASE